MTSIISKSAKLSSVPWNDSSLITKRNFLLLVSPIYESNFLNHSTKMLLFIHGSEIKSCSSPVFLLKHFVIFGLLLKTKGTFQIRHH